MHKPPVEHIPEVRVAFHQKQWTSSANIFQSNQKNAESFLHF